MINKFLYAQGIGVNNFITSFFSRTIRLISLCFLLSIFLGGCENIQRPEIDNTPPVISVYTFSQENKKLVPVTDHVTMEVHPDSDFFIVIVGADPQGIKKLSADYDEVCGGTLKPVQPQQMDSGNAPVGVSVPTHKIFGMHITGKEFYGSCSPHIPSIGTIIINAFNFHSGNDDNLSASFKIMLNIAP